MADAIAIHDAQTKNRMSSLPELRKATRYRLAFTAIIRWLGADKELREASTSVRNISTCGVYVECDVPLLVSTNVELEILVPSLDLDTPRAKLHFEGRIVRTQRNDQKTGLAVAGSLCLSARGDLDAAQKHGCRPSRP